MQKKNKRNFTITGLLSLAAALFTLAVNTIDVQPIGPEQSRVGLASVNQFLFNVLGVSRTWYTITDLLGLAAIFTAMCFAAVGLVQLIKRKRIAKVDGSILALGVFYILTASCYIIFEVFIVNYRPILMDGQLEASFPSSHTMLVYCIMMTAMIQFHELVESRNARVAFDTAASAIIAVTVIGRFLSGVHWFTDIIGGLLIGSALIMLYYSFVKLAKKRQQETQRRELEQSESEHAQQSEQPEQTQKSAQPKQTQKSAKQMQQSELEQ